MFGGLYLRKGHFFLNVLKQPVLVWHDESNYGKVKDFLYVESEGLEKGVC
jgi:hypothetical protein